MTPQDARKAMDGHLPYYTPCMCGRFSQFSAYLPLAKRLRVAVTEDPPPRYNVAPGTWIAGFRQAAHDAPPEHVELWWGYHPAWAEATASKPINARSETVATSVYFKNAFRRHRCIVPADGWYEWIATETGKQPHYLTRADREPIAFAGIYSRRENGSLGCAILTEPARGSAAEVHDRMPLILDDASLEPWLDPDMTDRETIRGVVHHIDAGLIEHWPVSRAVNKPQEGQGSELINPA